MGLFFRKSWFILLGGTLALWFGFAMIAYTGDSVSGDHCEYEVLESSGLHNIIWDRKVKEIEVIQVSTHTLYINWVSSVPASQLQYSSWAYTLDGGTAQNKHVESIVSDEMSVFISSHGTVNTIKVLIQGKGW